MLRNHGAPRLRPGFRVDFVTEATLTFDMQHEDGTPLPAAAIKARTAAVLKDRFATIRTVAQAIDRPGTPA